MGISLDTIERLRVACSELPEVDKAKRLVTKQEAVSLLKKEIAALRRKGYTLDEIADHFTRQQMPISGKTLKSYLSRRNGSASVRAAAQPAEQASGKSATMSSVSVADT